jgi:hypothetical protein
MKYSSLILPVTENYATLDFVLYLDHDFYFVCIYFLVVLGIGPKALYLPYHLSCAPRLFLYFIFEVESQQLYNWPRACNALPSTFQGAGIIGLYHQAWLP